MLSVSVHGTHLQISICSHVAEEMKSVIKQSGSLSSMPSTPVWKVCKCEDTPHFKTTGAIGVRRCSDYLGDM